MDNELFWRAVIANDIRFDGVFYLCVRTTAIYCRPSCRARLPLRKNVTFVATTGEAEKLGMRACLRCRPNEIGTTSDRQAAKFARACEMIDGDTSLTLDRLAAELGLSPSHFQRSFKTAVGISPKKYADAKRIEKFKSEISSGSDVTAALYDAGFASSSRLYEKASETLGMSPRTYKKGGSGMSMEYAIADCELGRMLVARTEKGVCSVTFGTDDTELIDGLHREFPNATIAAGDERLRPLVEDIIRHISGKSRNIELPLDVQATAFQIRVWQELRRIPYGETVSYGRIAEQLGDKNKVRAVAGACAANRLAVLIPCHRVVGTNGKLTGYKWGVERKRQLLEKELAAKNSSL